MQRPIELSDPNDPGITRQVQGDTLYIMGVTLNLDQGDIPYATPPNGVAVPGTQDVLIYADTVTLGGAVTNPGRKIQIVARRLAVTAASTIDVSGPAGSPNTPPGVLPDQPNQSYGSAGANGVDGGAGGNGGSIILYVAELTGAAEGSTPATLTLNADGGAGGRGQDGGAGIQGAPGQPGVTPVWYPNMEPGPGCGGLGGDAGNAGNGGNGGNGGAVTVNVVASIQPSLLTTSVTAGGGGAGGTAGQYGQGGPGYGGGGGWGPPGRPGRYGNWGAAGTAGGAAIAPNGQFTYADLSEQTTLAQLQMLQQQADSAFLGKDYATAARIYDLLIALTQGAVGAASPTPDLQARAAINAACLCELSRMKQGLDFFGLRPDWAPTLTLDLLQTEIQTMLDLSSQLAASLTVLQDAQQTAEQKLQALQAAEQKAAAKAAATQQQIDAVGQQLDDFVQSLALQLNQIDQQYAIVGGLMAQLQEDAWEADHPGCSTMRALTVCGSVISTGLSIEDGFSEVTAAGEALFESGNLVDGLTNGISLIQTVKNDVGQLNDAYNDISGYISGSTPDGGKLLTDEASYDAWADQYVNQYAGTVAALKSAVSRYFDLVKTRNGNVLSYNAVLLHKQRLQAEADQQTAVFEQIAAELAAQNDPTNPAYTAFLQGVDAQTRLYLLRRLNDEIRAFMYCSVDGDMGAGTPPALPTDTQLSSLQAAQLEIVAGIDAWQDAGSPLGVFEARQITFTRADFPDAFAALTASCQAVGGQTPEFGHLFIRSDIVRDAPAFIEMVHVVAMNVRVILPDLAGTTSGTLVAGIDHGGSSLFQKADGVTNVRFTHQIRRALYEYDYSKGQDASQAVLGDPKHGFAGLSPFSDWILKLCIQGDPDLARISGLNSVVLEFSGSFLPAPLR